MSGNLDLVFPGEVLVKIYSKVFDGSIIFYRDVVQENSRERSSEPSFSTSAPFN